MAADAGAGLPLLYITVSQVVFHRSIGDDPISDAGLLICSSIIVFVFILFYLLRLDTEVHSDGLYVRFFPFRRSFRRISWAEITTLYIRRYSPVWEYGGWGYRIGLFGKGKALSVSGSMGLQLVLHDGSKLLIGTAKAEELKEVLDRLGRLNK